MLHQLNEENALETYIGEVAITDVIEVLLSKIGKEGLKCVERLGQSSLRVYFKDVTNVNKFLNEPVVVNGIELCFFPVGEKLKTVFVKGLPFNVPEKTLHEAIKKYGKLHSIGYERYAAYRPVCTGTRILKMKLSNSIPNFLRVGKYMAVINYKNQMKVCRRCGGNNHFAKECNTRREDFKDGFPVHTRPFALKTGSRLGNSNKSTNTEIQTMVSGETNITIPNQSLNFSADACSSKSSNVSFTSIAQRLNGLRLEGINGNSDTVMHNSSQVSTSIPSVGRLQKKGKQNGCGESSFPVESLRNQDYLAGVRPKDIPHSLGVPEDFSCAADNLIERNQCGTISNKRKKKKKKKSNK